MFEVGWTEMLVIAIVMIVVVGPKDLPNMLRTFGRMTAKMRGMAADFQKQFNEALKEAELDDVKKSVDALRGLNPATEIRKQLNPFEKAAADVRAGLDSAMKPKPAEPPVVQSADTGAQPAEPLKNGATVMPGVSGPDAMPEAPVFPAMTEKSAAPAPAVQDAQPVDPLVAAASAAPARAASGAARVAKAKPAGANGKTPAKATKPASKAIPAKAEPATTAAKPAKAVAAKAKPAKARKPAGAAK